MSSTVTVEQIAAAVGSGAQARAVLERSRAQLDAAFADIAQARVSIFDSGAVDALKDILNNAKAGVTRELALPWLAPENAGKKIGATERTRLMTLLRVVRSALSRVEPTLHDPGLSTYFLDAFKSIVQGTVKTASTTLVAAAKTAGDVAGGLAAPVVAALVPVLLVAGLGAAVYFAIIRKAAP